MALKFDTTINVNHVGSLVVIAAACLAGFYSQGNRISILEDRDTQARLVANEKQGEAKETLREIKSDIKDLQRSVNEISRVVAMRPGATTVNNGPSR